jgi:hypothetical protein
MDQDTLRFLLREAVRETVTEVLQTVLELDRTAFLQAHGGRRNGYYLSFFVFFLNPVLGLLLFLLGQTLAFYAAGKR